MLNITCLHFWLFPTLISYFVSLPLHLPFAIRFNILNFVGFFVKKLLLKLFTNYTLFSLMHRSRLFFYKILCFPFHYFPIFGWVANLSIRLFNSEFKVFMTSHWVLGAMLTVPVAGTASRLILVSSRRSVVLGASWGSCKHFLCPHTRPFSVHNSQDLLRSCAPGPQRGVGICNCMGSLPHAQVSRAFCLLDLASVLSRFSCVWFFVTHGLQPARLLCPWDSPGRKLRGCHALLQGIFPTQGLNLISPALAGGFFTTSTTWEAPTWPRGWAKWA